MKQNDSKYLLLIVKVEF